MHYTILLLLFVASCGTPKPSNKTVIGPPSTANESEVISDTSPDETTTTSPDLEGDNVNTRPLGYFEPNKGSHFSIDNKQTKNGKTVIQCSGLPVLTIPKTYGGVVSSLPLKGFDRDILVFKARIKDSDFDKYYTYIYKDNAWREVVNPFAIHISHREQAVPPFTIDPSNPNYVKRYYSVFDLDTESDLGYTWRLLSESIPIINR